MTGSIGRVRICAVQGSEALAAACRDAGLTVSKDGEILLIDTRGAQATDLVRWMAEIDLAVTAGVPVVAIAGEEEGHALDSLIESGATAMLRLPCAPGDLLRTLRIATTQFARNSRGAPDRVSRLSIEHDEADATMLVVALTRFEVVNIAFGRATGDKLLEAAGRRLSALAATRSMERLDGPEFAVLCDADCMDAAERIVDRLEQPFLIEGRVLRVGVQVGIAKREPEEPLGTLLRRARLALAVARTQDDVAVHRLTPNDQALALVDGSLEDELRAALAEDRIDILFQPVIEIASGRATSVEVLARWRHEGFGELGAGMLFAVASRAGLAPDLSRHLLAASLARAAAWQGPLAGLRLAVNVTASDLVRPNFVQRLSDMLAMMKLVPERLTLELTETELMRELERGAALLEQLRALGCRIAIDDFGTGYSSLAYLKSLPVDLLKLDKQLVEDIDRDPRDRVVADSVLDLARALSLDVIAEGVEREEQLAVLRAGGCRYVQGYLFAPPLDEPSLAEFVSAGASPGRATAAARR